MRVYFDRANLLSFFACKEKDIDFFEDCLRMLRSQCDMIFNFPKSLLLQDKDLQEAFTQFNDGCKGHSFHHKFFESPFPSRPLNPNVHKQMVSREDLTAIYLIDDEKSDMVKHKGCILIGNKGEEIEILSKLYFEHFQFTKAFTPEHDMPNWNILEPVALPCTDIIITDKFLFSSPELLDYNLHSYLSVLVGKYEHKKMNIIIFTCFKQKIKGADGKIIEWSPDWNTIKSNLKSKIKKDLHATPNVTIVALQSIDEHDRTIFTNYNNSASGDSLTYYDSHWNLISNVRYFTVYSHGLRDNLSMGFYYIDDMQGILDNMTSVKDKEKIYGDKICNFLKFPD